MKALTWYGKARIRCGSVRDPKVEDGTRVVLKP